MTLQIEAPKILSFESAVSSPGKDSITIGQILSALWRRRTVFLSVFFTILVAGFAILKSLTPTYTSTAIIVLAARQDGVVDMQQPYMNASPSDPVVRSEVDALKSRSLIDRLVDRANLLQDPEFNLYKRPFQPNRVLCLPAPLLPGFLQVSMGCRQRSPGQLTPDQIKYNVVSQVLKAYSVLPDPKTYSVQLSITSMDAQKAARLTNMLADEYMKSQVDEKIAEARRAMATLNPRLQELSKEVARADRAVQQFKEANHIVDMPGSQGQDNTLALEQVQGLAQELAMARTARAKLEAAQVEVEQLLRDPSQTLSAPAVAAAPVVENLRVQEATASAKLASLLGTYGERHPMVVSARNEVNQLHQRLAEEAQSAMQQLRAQVRQAQGSERQLQARMDQLTSARTGESRALPELRQLGSVQTAAKTVYDAFVQGLYRAASQNGVPTAKGRIVQRADVSDWPAFPNTLISMAIIAIAALMVSTGIVYGLEAADRSFHSAGEIENVTGLPVLGTALAARAPSRLLSKPRVTTPPSRQLIAEPLSAMSESIRLARTAIAVSGPERAPKVVMITSAVPGEGKTTFALMLARQSAASGTRTIIVEAEMRRPRFSRDLQAIPVKGLADYLMGRASLDEILGIDPDSGMHYIAAGELMQGSCELLASSRMEALLRGLASDYDLVVVDTPPAAVVADALQLSGMVDACILTVKWASTPRHLVLDAIKKLQAARAPLAGVVLTQVDAYKYKFYGQGTLPYEYARGYYSEA